MIWPKKNDDLEYHIFRPWISSWLGMGISSKAIIEIQVSFEMCHHISYEATPLEPEQLTKLLYTTKQYSKRQS